jgi:hypothetical protein
LKASNAISAKATASLRSTGPSSDRPRPSRTAESFALSGKSAPPDPAANAYRPDLADAALTGQVIASHYADPVDRVTVAAVSLRASASEDAETIRELSAGEPFAMLDDTLGWAWGYAGEDRRVGYVRSEALRAL